MIALENGNDEVIKFLEAAILQVSYLYCMFLWEADSTSVYSYC